MMVIFLTGLVSMILMRTLRNDYAKYAREEDDLDSLVMIFCRTFFLLSIDNHMSTGLIVTFFQTRKETSMKNLAGSLCMVMFSGHLEI